jgi:hypothetical protein
MRRIKSAPANIAGMVNRKKTEKMIPIPTDNKVKVIYLMPEKKLSQELIKKDKLNNIKNQKNVEKIFNNMMLESINDKQFINTNDEETIALSILYYYISEKVFTKKNLHEFILFLIQIFLRYVITHVVHETLINNIHLINNVHLMIK